MFRQLNLRSWFTFLSRNRLYTAVNFIGLALALAFVLLGGRLYGPPVHSR